MTVELQREIEAAGSMANTLALALRGAIGEGLSVLDSGAYGKALVEHADLLADKLGSLHARLCEAKSSHDREVG